ncbi:MAG: response regulator [Planctomycetes bacterium]|nr:response regulator [Planctomycetota bacterium]
MRLPIRVMIANDSAVIRRLVTEALTDANGFEVFPVVHGGDALNQMATVRPHVLILDTEMPVMNGLQTVRLIRQDDTCLPIIMLCRSTDAGLKATVEAIPAGANDCAKFSARIGHAASAKKHLHDELIPKIRYWAEKYIQHLVLTENVVPVET